MIDDHGAGCDLSIVVPVYNAEASLPALLDDLQLCPATRVQIVLSNDGSKDNSLALCLAFEARRDNVIVIDQPNGGSSVARNAAMEQTVGAYTGFCDSDDRLDAEALMSVLDKALAIDADMAVFNYVQVDKRSGRVLRASSLETHDFVFTQDFPMLCDASCFNNLWNKLFKTDFLRRHQISFEPGIAPGQDLRFNLDAFLHIEHGLVCDDSAYRYVVRQSESMTTSYHPQLFTEYVYSLGRIEQLMRARDTYSGTFMARRWVQALIYSAYSITSKGGPPNPLAGFRKFKANAREARQHADLSRATPFEDGFKIRALVFLARNKQDAALFFIIFIVNKLLLKMRGI
jgi:glycosyltransferase involved in cell wall biosynthesis